MPKELKKEKKEFVIFETKKFSNDEKQLKLLEDILAVQKELIDQIKEMNQKEAPTSMEVVVSNPEQVGKTLELPKVQQVEIIEKKLVDIEVLNNGKNVTGYVDVFEDGTKTFYNFKFDSKGKMSGIKILEK